MKRLSQGKRLRTALQIATDVIPKLPNGGDSLLTKIVKVFGIVDSFYKYGSKIEKSALRTFLDRIDADDSTNAQFVDLFYNTSLRDAFEVEKILLDANIAVIFAHRDDIGSLWFIEWQYGSRPEPSNDFYFSPGFDFVKMLDLLWDQYKDGIYVETTRDNWRLKTSYQPLVIPDSPLLGSANERLDRLVSQQKRYQEDGIPRTWLFIGPPGTGKSTMAVRMARAVGNRTLQIDSTTLSDIGRSELFFLIDVLKPDFLIFDDIDKVNMEHARPTVLAIMSGMQAAHPEITTIFTVNDPDKLDPAMIRPERIDEIEEFDASDRAAIFQGYLTYFGVKLSQQRTRKVLKTHDQFTAVWLRETAQRLRYKPYDQVLKEMSRMWELHAKKATDAKKAEPKADSPPTLSK